jgi:hypothetical protein
MSLKTFAEVEERHDHVTFSFAATDRWVVPEDLISSGRTANTPFDTTALLLGDETKGPLLLFLSVEPGFSPPDSPAHGHASDNFRLSARGVLPMGPEKYGPGEFRFQRGWKPYPSDNYAHGPDGGWSMLCFADRRGVKTRYVSPSAPTHAAGDAKFAAWLGIRGDLTSDDPADAPGPSALVTNVGPLRKPFLSGSFAAAENWPAVGEFSNVGAALMGDPECGPMLILASTKPGGRAASEFSVDTELFHMVVRGECSIGGVGYGCGDVRVQRPGSPVGPIIAGPGGVDEVIILGDRRGSAPRFVDQAEGWPTAIEPLLRELSETLPT